MHQHFRHIFGTRRGGRVSASYSRVRHGLIAAAPRGASSQTHSNKRFHPNVPHINLKARAVRALLLYARDLTVARAMFVKSALIRA